jgi:hypothetical protein
MKKLILSIAGLAWFAATTLSAQSIMLLGTSSPAGFSSINKVGCSTSGALPGTCPASVGTTLALAVTPTAGQFLGVQIATDANSNTVTSVFATSGSVTSSTETSSATILGTAGTSYVLAEPTTGGCAGVILQFTLTGTNSIAGAVATPVGSNQGSGCEVPPTTAACVNGTATCTGNITFTSVLSGNSLGSADFVSAPGVTGQSNQAIAWYHLSNVPAGIIAVYAAGAQVYTQMVAYTATALPTSGTVDVTATGLYNTSATSQTSTNTGTPAANGDLFIGGCSARSAGTYTIGTSPAWVESLNFTSTVVATDFGYYLQATAAPIAFTATLSSSAKYSCGGVAYEF